MIIGVPKEIKNSECRVALTPGAAATLVAYGHKVLVEAGSGNLARFPDAQYKKSGAVVVKSAKEVWQKSDLVVKVKEPQPSETKFLHKDKLLLCFLHLAAEPAVTRALMKSGTIAFACETIRDNKGRLPILEPMSEIAGRMAAIVGAYYLSTPRGGRGVLVSGLPGVLPARYVVVGGGSVGENAARIAAGMEAQVIVADKDASRLRLLDEILPENVSTLASSPSSLEEAFSQADVVIGAVLVPGAKAPKLITRKMIKKMRPGSVLVDVCIDQGGISETSRPTTHSNPTYFVDGVLHYCVTNMPGAYGRTATLAYANAILPYVTRLAQGNLKEALRQDAGLVSGLNVCRGKVTNQIVADALKLPFQSWTQAL